ncbi:MAG: membrane lipoprotein lipid attachment site-containing protein [Elusimicrobiaceae bacterium]|nr:membrane lipoprotein lipid attachment site-containing protein [Elusimicrobiaceae bacterium]
MKKLICLLGLILAVTACNSLQDKMYYRPNAQIMPQHITKIHVRPIINRTEVFALEDRLVIEVVDEFLRNGSYSITQEDQADGILAGEILRYILIPVQYDTQLVPTVYRMEVLLNLRFIDKNSQETIWQEPALQQIYIYSDATLPGGMTEEQAREELWKNFAKMIVKRTVEGFGSVASRTRQQSQVNPNQTTITK